MNMSNCYERAMAFTLLDIVSSDSNLQFQSNKKDPKTANLIEYYSPTEPKVAQKIEVQLFHEEQNVLDDESEELEMLLDMIQKTGSTDHIVDLFKVNTSSFDWKGVCSYIFRYEIIV
jgi:hypothetical protein